MKHLYIFLRKRFDMHSKTNNYKVSKRAARHIKELATIELVRRTILG